MASENIEYSVKLLDNQDHVNFPTGPSPHRAAVNGLSGTTAGRGRQPIAPFDRSVTLEEIQQWVLL